MADESELTITDDNIEETVKEGVTLIDFWAPWCGPCRMQGPIVEAVAEKYSGKAKVGKCNVDENQKTAAKLGIQSIPTLVLYKDGEVVERFVGVTQEDDLSSALDKEL